MKSQSNLFAHERPALILDTLAKEGKMDIHALAKLLGVSLPTLRRDLVRMEADGRVVRVHGGILHPKAVLGESSLDIKKSTELPAKRQIAARAAKLVPAGATVFLDAGTTTLEIGRALFPRKDVRLITHSVPLLAEALAAGVPMLGVGGEVRVLSGAMIGEATGLALSRLHVNIAFLGASGLDGRGVWTTEPLEAEIKARILEAANLCVLAADTRKWNVPHTLLFAEWDKFDLWLCDTPPPAADCRKIEKAGCKVTAK